MNIIQHIPVTFSEFSGKKRQKSKTTMPWVICKRCGLVFLDNEITRAAIKYGCEHESHPEYIKVEKRIRENN